MGARRSRSDAEHPTGTYFIVAFREPATVETGDKCAEEPGKEPKRTPMR
jgi:hypothetical protein